MARIRGTLSLAAALVGGALTWGQDAPKPTAPKAGENVLSLVKEGQAGRRCKVLRTYKHPSGGTAYEVKAEDTGEIMTVIEGVAADGKKDIRIEPKVAKVVVKPATPVVKPVAKAAKPVAKTAAKPAAKPDKATGVKTVAAAEVVEGPRLMGDDPILNPKASVVNAKVIKEFVGDAKPAGDKPAAAPVKPTAKPAAKPATQYTQQPVPATRRWFPGFRAEPKPVARVVTPPLPPQVTIVSVNPMAMPLPYPQAGPVVPAAFVAATSSDPVIRLIGRLRDDLLPSMREISAEQLAYFGRGRPDATAALVEAAQTDPAPSVRGCCLYFLGQMGAKSPTTVTVMQSVAQTDGDAMVRQTALSVLSSW